MTTDPHEGKVCISRLPKDKKRQVWAFIQEQRPETAALLTTDPVVKKLEEVFGPLTIWLPLEDTGLEPPK